MFSYSSISFYTISFERCDSSDPKVFRLNEPRMLLWYPRDTFVISARESPSRLRDGEKDAEKQWENLTKLSQQQKETFENLLLWRSGVGRNLQIYAKWSHFWCEQVDLSNQSEVDLSQLSQLGCFVFPD